MAKTPITLTLNGSERAGFSDPGENLLNFLRRGLGDLSPKYGCGQGTCGACTVLVDGQPQLSCLILAETVLGKSISTTAGLADGAQLHALQVAFIDGFAAQCGYCTPGMLMAAKTLLDENRRPSRAEIEEAISGNLCRCTGYAPIIDAILVASGQQVPR